MTLSEAYGLKLVDASFMRAASIVAAYQKVYNYDDGVFYEVRRLVLPTRYRVKTSFTTAGYIKDYRLMWEPSFEALGCDFKGLMPSTKSAVFWGEGGKGKGTTFTTSTFGKSLQHPLSAFSGSLRSKLRFVSFARRRRDG